MTLESYIAGSQLATLIGFLIGTIAAAALIFFTNPTK